MRSVVSVRLFPFHSIVLTDSPLTWLFAYVWVITAITFTESEGHGSRSEFSTKTRAARVSTATSYEQYD